MIHDMFRNQPFLPFSCHLACEQVFILAVDGMSIWSEKIHTFLVEGVNSESLKILQSSNLSTQNLTPTTPTLRVLRKVKGNLTCAQPGCAAEVMLQIYDPVEDGGKMGKR